MKILFIDGEYLKKIVSIEELEKFLLLAFGQVEYPERIVYYSSEISEHQKNLMKKIKNLEINSKGYLTTYDGGKKVQKGVDGYIIADMVCTIIENKDIDINVIAGDGDLIAGFEKYFTLTNKKIKLLCRKNSVAERLFKFSKVYYIDNILRM